MLQQTTAAWLVAAILWTRVSGEEEERILSRCPSRSYIRCADGMQCIHKRWMCDGRIDCPDHSDEDQSVCSQRSPHGSLDGSGRFVPRTIKCSGGRFFCSDGSKCLASRLVCDQIEDCSDGSDEGALCHHWKALQGQRRVTKKQRMRRSCHSVRCKQ